MDDKNKKHQNNTKHLEKALFENRIASANDCTGFMVTPPYTNTKSGNISQMLNVPTSVCAKKKKNTKNK